MKRSKVVVFGGSFSPPTLAHTEIIARCLAVPGVDEVWLVPSGSRTDKNIAVTAADQLAMLKIVVIIINIANIKFAYIIVSFCATMFSGIKKAIIANYF